MSIGHKGKRRYKLQFSIYIREDQAEDLSDLNAATQVPVAVMVRDAIDVMLKGRQLELKTYRRNLPKVYKAE